MMKYLVFAIWESDTPFSLSREIDLDKSPPLCSWGVIDYIAKEGLGKASLFEVFVFQSVHEGAPKQVAYWNQDDGLFGDEENV